MSRFGRVCVVGAGAIGSLCAGHLGQVAEVSVLTRRPAHAEALLRDGLRVSGKSDLHTRVHASVDPATMPEPDLVIVATKATQISEAGAALSGRFPEAVVMTIQNGVGAEEIIHRLGPWEVVSSVTFMSGTRESDTHVHYELDTATWIGPYPPSGADHDTALAVGHLFADAGLAVEVLADLRPAQWSKLIFNASVNSVAALTDLPHVALYARRDRPTDLGHLMFALIEEGKLVAREAGIELFEDPWEMNVEAVSRGATHHEEYAHVPSMLADVRAGQKTEIDFILGAVVREADRVGADVPLSRALYQLVKGRDRSYDDEVLL